MTPEMKAAGAAAAHLGAASTPAPATTTVYLSLGANLGDRRASLRLALQRLADHPQVSLDTNRDVARLYQTSPVDCDGTQPAYFNTAARIRTALSPQALLTLTQRIESELGRVRPEEPSKADPRHQPTKNESKNQPRTIDIDILFFGDLVLRDERLEIPHPRLAERRFVLEPLADLAPDHRLNSADQTDCQKAADSQTVADAARACRRRYPHQAIEVVEEGGEKVSGRIILVGGRPAETWGFRLFLTQATPPANNSS